MTTPWRVGARGDGVLPWCIPLPDASSVADLQRAVETRQNKLREEDTESPKAAIGIQLKVDGELYAVDSDDLLLNLIPKDSKGAMFVAYRAGGVPITPSADAPEVVANEGAAASTPSPSHTPVQHSTATTQDRRRMATVTPPARKLLSSWPPARNSSSSSSRSSRSSSSRKHATARSKTTKNRSRSASRNKRTKGINDIDNLSPCQACRIPIDPARRPSFSCRACNKLFHAACVGYDPRKRQSPPPSWICPCCPDGERGPSAAHLHASLKGKGIVTQKHGNQPWCPICLDDNRAPGMVTMGSS
ncbi:unnamed protein product, partial [Ectocarpus sp. 12 AP-2014]